MAILGSKIFGALFSALIFSQTCQSYPQLVNGLYHRQIDESQLRESYDYILVGGGQSGVVIGTRLSEDPSKTVLIVDYGFFDRDPAELQPNITAIYPSRDLFNVTSVPQRFLNNQRQTVWSASVVGGGSIINGMYFFRGSAEDYDNWERLGNPGWGWKGLLPYFKKSTTFTPPDAALAREFNITWDLDAWGTDGPIQATYPPYQYPGEKPMYKAWSEVGVPSVQEGVAGDVGNYWITSNVVPKAITRSQAVNAYFDPVAKRKNLHLITGQRVNEVLFRKKHATAVKIQARGTDNGAPTITIKAKKEIIITAGWLHTPQVLQRSGIGPKALLKKAGIDVLVDLPGVGSNLQDHMATRLTFNFTTNFFPNPDLRFTNATWLAEAQAEFDAHRTGPLSVGVGNSAAMVPLPVGEPAWRSYITKLEAQTKNLASYLPDSYTKTEIAGYKAQHMITTERFASNHSAVMEIPYSAGSTIVVLIEKPLSRGVVGINTTDIYAEPFIDFHTLQNPVDVDMVISMIRLLRRYIATPTIQAAFHPIEITPGLNVTNPEDLIPYIKSTISSSTAHGSCTAAMMPRELGGVVGPDLLVYGVTGLSVADASIMPMVPATHLCATVYATAEKASDIIKKRHGHEH